MTKNAISTAATGPVCQMSVDPETALSTTQAGHKLHFCSSGCRDKFVADPSASVSTKTTTEMTDNADCCGSKPTNTSSSKGGGRCDVATPDTAEQIEHRTYQNTCFCHPDFLADEPGDRPKRGVSLEPVMPTNGGGSTSTIYTCPMHPEIEQYGPGDCPICGMALEPKTVSVGASSDESDDEELVDMTRRFWVGLALGLPVLILAMGPMVGLPVRDVVSPRLNQWLQLVLSIPIVLWCGVAGHSLCGAGSRSSTATATCSR